MTHPTTEQLNDPKALPPVGTSNANSQLIITCITPRVEVWEVIAHRDDEAVVYAPACDSNGTSQAEVYLLSAREFHHESALRIKEKMAEIISTMEVRYTDGSFELFPGPVVDELLSRFDVSFKE